MLACQPRLSTIMDSQGAKSSCFHLNAINECRTKIVNIEQEKVPMEKSIQTLDDDIEEIEEFVFDYDGNIPEIVFQTIRSKQEILMESNNWRKVKYQNVSNILKISKCTGCFF